MSPKVLYLSDELAAFLLSAAARAFPLESCGLIEGRETEDGWIATAVHEAANLAEDPARAFLIDPEVQFKLLRTLRGTASRLIGCYHSHPGGPADPSATDSAQAMETDFLWLIAGGAPETGFALRAYVFSEGGGFSTVALRDEG